MGGVGDDCVIKPGGCGVMISCICPSVVIVGDSECVDHMGPIEQVIEFFALWVCEGVDCNVGVWDVACKLPLHSF